MIGSYAMIVSTWPGLSSTSAQILKAFCAAVHWTTQTIPNGVDIRECITSFKHIVSIQLGENYKHFKFCWNLRIFCSFATFSSKWNSHDFWGCGASYPWSADCTSWSPWAAVLKTKCFVVIHRHIWTKLKLAEQITAFNKTHKHTFFAEFTCNMADNLLNNIY